MMTTATMMLDQARKAFVAGDMAAAERLCRSLIAAAPALADPWIILGDINLRLGRPELALAAADNAIALAPNRPFGYIVRCNSLIALSKFDDAVQTVEDALRVAECPLDVIDSFGLIYVQLGRHARALALLRLVATAEPTNAAFLYHLAVAERGFGDLAEAENLLDRIISRNSHYYDAYFMRADLRKQTTARNHVVQIEGLLAEGVRHPRGEIALRFALGKEYDDLGDPARAFHHIKAGADLQRKRLRYDIKGNIAVIDRIIQAQGAEALAAARPTRHATDNPIFIVGLPRSGTTLVERIVAGHSAVMAAGELGILPSELIRAAKASGIQREGDWIERLAAIDLTSTGNAYARVARETGIPPDMRFIDKYPPNFLLCGVIRLALPNARIIALRRGPMDSCFALYRTLFNQGVYPYSYHLDEIAEYYAAFRRLMRHWRSALPQDVFTEVSYEEIVADVEGQSRRILSFLDLPWEDGVQRFHENTAPATTASAAQIRQPIYSSSVGKWRRYAEHLAPLRIRLAELMPEDELGPA